MQLLVHGEFACLTECFGASFVGTSEGLLSRVNVGMFFQVLPESKLFKADDTHELLCWLMSSQVASKGEASSELFVTMRLFAFKWSFHVVNLWFYRISVCYRYVIILLNSFWNSCLNIGLKLFKIANYILANF